MTDIESLTVRLRAAVQAVEAAGVPDDLREIAFARALDATLGPATPYVAPAVASAHPADGPSPTSQPHAPTTADRPLATLARKLGIEEATAARVYDLDDDGLHLVAGPARFDSRVTAAMEQIARLVVAGRQAAGLDEEWTSADQIRVACEDRGRYSDSNFATYVKRLDGDGFRIRGNGRNREFKANAIGFEHTGELVAQLAGQE
jgi:hypothetical protein